MASGKGQGPIDPATGKPLKSPPVNPKTGKPLPIAAINPKTGKPLKASKVKKAKPHPKKAKKSKAKSKAPKSKAPKAKKSPKTTRATATHNAARSRLDQMEAAIRRALKQKQQPQDRAALKNGLKQIKEHREWIATSDKTSAPVGKVHGYTREMDTWQNSAMGSYPEPRTFNTGNQFSGYMEGRPGAVTVISVQPFSDEPLAPGWAPDPPPPDVIERIKNFPQVLDAPTAQRAKELVDIYSEAWAICDAYGAECEMEVDGESGEGES